MGISFLAFDPLVKQLRADKGFRVELEVAQDQYDAIKELPTMQGKVLKITVEDQGDKI